MWRACLLAAAWGLSVAIDSECSDWGEDCSQTQCCKPAGSACYKKHEWYSACLTECDASTSADGEEWDCTQLGEETPKDSPKSNSNHRKHSKHSKHIKASTTTTDEVPTPEPTDEPASESTMEPTHSTPESTQSTPEPTESTPEPTQSTRQPTVSTPEPTVSTPAPTASTPAPMDSTPEPTPEPTQGPTPEPTASTPEPTESTPEPTDSTPAPTKSTPEPPESTPEPTVSTPEPTESTPAPTKSTPEPTESTPEPTVSTPEPTESTPAPTKSTPEPTESTPEPTPEPTEAMPEQAESTPEHSDSTADCRDSDKGALDKAGDSCAHGPLSYSQNPTYCGQEYDDTDFTALHMCCACGVGGTAPTASTADFSEPAPMPAPSTTQEPTESTPEPTPEPTEATPEPAESTPERTDSTTDCRDSNEGALDKAGDSCAHGPLSYSQNPTYCGQEYDDTDFTALDMCCACGVGGVAPTTSAADSTEPAPTPAESTTQEPTTSTQEPAAPVAEPTPLPTQEREPETLEILGVDGGTIIMKETMPEEASSRSDNPNKTCAPCTPRKRSTPDVVIPIWEHDLCKVSYTVMSIGVHDPQGILGTVVLLWVSQRSSSEYQEALDQIKESVSASHKVKLVDLSEHVNSAEVGPWVAQQVFKLKAAALVESDFYVVLDARNALVRDLEPDVFFTECNQGKIFGEFEPDQIPQPYAEWYEASARSLGVHAPGLADPITERWPTSITPVVIHRRTVFDLLDFIGEERSADRMCSGPLCDMLSGSAADGGGATDFTLFVLFARTQPEISCNLAVEDSEYGPVALTLWQSSEDAQMEANLQTCRDVASGEQQPYFFGSQTAALEQMSDEQRQDAQKLLVEIYNAAKLHDSSRTSSDALVSCVAGDLGGKAGPIEDVEARSVEIADEDGADDAEGFCCSDAQDSSDICGTCWEGAELLRDTYCGASKKHCESCQGTWCSSSSDGDSDGEAKDTRRSNRKDANDTGLSDKKDAKHTKHHSKDWRRWVKISCEENECEKYDTEGCECNERCEQHCDDDMLDLRRFMDKKFSALEPIQEASRSLDWTKVFLAASLLCMVTAVALALARRPRPLKSSSMHQVLVEDMSCSEA